MQRIKAYCISIITTMTVTACSSMTPNFYKLDVRQGNVLEPDKVAQLQPGMTMRQVQNILGSPLLTDPFHQDRWDYVYAFYPRGNREKGVERRLTLYFQGTILAGIEGIDSIPPAPTESIAGTMAETQPSALSQSQQPAFFQFDQPIPELDDEVLLEEEVLTEPLDQTETQ